MVKSITYFSKVFVFFTSVLFFSYLFLFSNFGFFERGEIFGVTCSSADEISGRTVCGHEVGALVNRGIYVCEYQTPSRGEPGYYWVHTNTTCSANEDCVSGECVESQGGESSCTSGTVTGGPPGSTRSVDDNAEHGQTACASDITGDHEYRCNDGNWVFVRSCSGDCVNRSCDGGGTTPGNGGSDGGTTPGNGGSDGGTTPGNGGSDGGTTPGNGGIIPGNGGGGGTVPSGGSPPQLEGIFGVIYRGVEFFFSFIAVVAAGMVVYGAYMWMASGGDPQKTKMAQGVLTWAIIGLVFFIMVPFFLHFILDLLGIRLPTP